MPEETTPPAAPPEGTPSTDPQQPDVSSLPEWARDALAKANREAANYRTKLREVEPLAKKAQEAEEASKSEHEKALEKARKEAGEAAGKEATAKANARIVRAEVKAAAGGKLADPNDAVRLLDLDEFGVDDDGEVDAKAIEAAIAKLVKDKPYLASGATRPAGDADQGTRSGNPPEPDTPRGLIAAGLAANEVARSRK